MGVVFVVVVCLVGVLAEPVRRIAIDGDFSDWANVPKRADPFRVSADEPSPMDGFPPAPDVHSDEQDNNTCFVRSEMFNPWADIISVALAHDEHQFFAYFKSVKSMNYTTSGSDDAASLLYVQINIDVDNNLTSGYASSKGGYYPNQNGVDMAFELEFYNGTLNTGHYILHNMWNASDIAATKELNKQGLVYFDGPADYNYTEWAYWPSSSPPSPSESLRCSLGAPLTSGPFVLPDGASICFVFERCDGPFLGGMRVAVSPDGTELELSAPFAGFLRDAATGQDAVRVGQTVTVQFSLETSGQLSLPHDWSTDATLPWVYHIDPPQIPVVALFLVPSAAFLVGAVLATLLVCFCKSRKHGYTAVP